MLYWQELNGLSMIYMVTGVSGVGKTTIGFLLSEKLKLPFYDADDFHPRSNVVKMAQGIALQDKDRSIWLKTLASNIKIWNNQGGAVLACSALKEQYREILKSIPASEITWIFLHSEFDIILTRLSNRKDHYFKPTLLQSQYDILEFPDYGIHINVDKAVDDIIEEIMKNLNSPKSKIGLLGLGVMGKSLAINLATNGIEVSVYNRQVEQLEVDIAKNFAAENKELFSFSWFDDLQEFIESLERPRNIILMVNAGKTVDMVINALLPLLDKNDLIIDGGNSFYKDTVSREKLLKERDIYFLGVGISGGEEGAKKGPSIMPGGLVEAYGRVGSFLETISAKDKNGKPCCAYIGPDGAGHFVKMVHNGIEYGEMQLIAEFYHFLRFGYERTPEEIANLFSEWNIEQGSYLLKITVEILRKKDEGDYLIDKILDAAQQKGTGGWSTNAALELGVPFDTITAAVMSRIISAKKEERQKANKVYTSVSLTDTGDTDIPDFELFSAYRAASIINHAIGFGLLNEASEAYLWNLNFSEISRIWTNGCIIKSTFMEELSEIFIDQPSENILLHPVIARRINSYKNAFKEVMVTAINKEFPMPVLSGAGTYFFGYTSDQTAANMIQAQRDFFGAHTYERIDRPKGQFFHTIWNENK